MAITHSIKFTASAKDAISEIGKYEDKIVATAQTVDKYANSLGGAKVLAQANNWVAAVDKIGGATRLTGAEQEKVNHILEQAIAKYQALGKTAPTAMTELYEATKKVPPALEASQTGAGGLLSKLGPLGPMIATTFSVGAIIGFGKELLATADATVKMADKTGMSVEAVQRLGYIAEQSGNTLDQVSGAVSQLQKRLAEGDTSAVGALKALGLEQARFMAMAPDQQFLTVARAVRDIEDPMQRVKVATELFGKTGADMLPTLVADVDALGAAASVMSAKATKAFDDIGDSIGRLTTKTKVLVGEGLATTMDSYARLWTGAGQAMAGQFADAAATLLDVNSELPKATVSAGKLAVASTSVALAWKQADDIGKDLTETTKKTAKATEDGAKAFAAARAKLNEIEDGYHGAGLAVWEFGRKFDDAAMGKVLERLDEIERRGEKITQQFWEMGRAVPAELPPAWGPIPGLPSIAQWTGNGFALIKEETTTSLTAGMSEAFASFPTLMVQSLTGGGGVSGAVEAFGSQVGSTIGKNVGASLAKSVGGMFGKVLGDLIPGLGAMLGPAIEWLGNKIFKVEGRKVNDLRDAYISAAGGLDVLNKKAHDAGMTLDALLKAKTVKDYEAAVAALNAKLEKTAQLQGELAGLQAQLASRQVMDWQRAQELIERYGGTLGNLGAQFTAAKQAADWKSIWDDWQSLIDMGADVGGVLVSMKDEIQNLVNQSVKIGTEIPAQFKPLIEELIRTNQLFNENGDAITDISSLRFGAPLVSEIDKIIAKIDELIGALTTGLTGAFKTVGNVRVPPIKIPYTYELTNQAPSGVDTLAMLHGSEAIVRRDQVSPVANPGPIQITVISQLDGREVARNQVRHLPSQLALAGL